MKERPGTDADYVLDLCDEVLGEPGLRGHVFPWLRDADGTQAAVSAYYPSRNLALVLVHAEPSSQTRRLLLTLSAHDVEPYPLSMRSLGLDALGELRRARSADLSQLDDMLAEGERERCRQGFGISTASHSVYYGAYADAEEDWEEGEPEPDADLEAENYEDYAEPVPPDLGWRTRPIALAILGAAALTRRAFSARVAGPIEPLELQVLASLALCQQWDGGMDVQPQGASALAASLAADRYEVQRGLKYLNAEGLVEVWEWADPDEDEARFALTEAGVAAIESWLAEAARLFPRWPPEDPAVDDAG